MGAGERHGIHFEGRVMPGQYWWAMTPSTTRVSSQGDEEIEGSLHVFAPQEQPMDPVVYGSLTKQVRELHGDTVRELEAQHEFAEIHGSPDRAAQFATRYGLLMGTSADREPLDVWFYESAAMAIVLKALESLANGHAPTPLGFHAPLDTDHAIDVWENEYGSQAEAHGLERDTQLFPALPEARGGWQDERWGVIHAFTNSRIRKHCGLAFVMRDMSDWPVTPDGSSPLRTTMTANNLLGALWFGVARAAEGGDWKVCEICDNWWLKSDYKSNRRFCSVHEGDAIGNLRKKAKAMRAKQPGLSEDEIAAQLGVKKGGAPVLFDSRSEGKKKTAG